MVAVSVLFNEPKLLKSRSTRAAKRSTKPRFSALQRAEIAEIRQQRWRNDTRDERFSALQRAEIAEIKTDCCVNDIRRRFSALQRAEIAEIQQALDAMTELVKFQCSSTSRNC